MSAATVLSARKRSASGKHALNLVKASADVMDLEEELFERARKNPDTITLGRYELLTFHFVNKFSEYLNGESSSLVYI